MAMSHQLLDRVTNIFLGGWQQENLGFGMPITTWNLFPFY
uniref:Retinol dehydrogenase 11-like n=1 Tax=Rhizophora mucronata TaxID=61149 RepID=A0A2P2NBK8_RHIMU